MSALCFNQSGVAYTQAGAARLVPLLIRHEALKQADERDAPEYVAKLSSCWGILSFVI